MVSRITNGRRKPWQISRLLSSTYRTSGSLLDISHWLSSRIYKYRIFSLPRSGASSLMILRKNEKAAISRYRQLPCGFVKIVSQHTWRTVERIHFFLHTHSPHNGLLSIIQFILKILSRSRINNFKAIPIVPSDYFGIGLSQRESVVQGIGFKQID